MTSNYSKVLLKMNTYFNSLINYFSLAIHPAEGKNELQRKKRKSAKQSSYPKSTPDCFNIRGLVRQQDSARRNPAP